MQLRQLPHCDVVDASTAGHPPPTGRTNERTNDQRPTTNERRLTYLQRPANDRYQKASIVMTAIERTNERANKRTHERTNNQTNERASERTNRYCTAPLQGCKFPLCDVLCSDTPVPLLRWVLVVVCCWTQHSGCAVGLLVRVSACCGGVVWCGVRACVCVSARCPRDA